MTKLNFKTVLRACIALILLYSFSGYLLILYKVLWSLVVVILKLLLCTAIGLAGLGLFIFFNGKEWKMGECIRLEPSEGLFNKTKDKLHEFKFIPKKGVKYKALISRNVDDVIDELITLLLRDYVSSWYNYIVREPSLLDSNLKPLIRQMLFTFRNKCQNIDDVKLFTYDIVNILNQHLQNVRLSASNCIEGVQAYQVDSFLENKEKEMGYLRKLNEFLLVTLLPPPYAKCYPLRHLLREIFANVFYNVINGFCNPDSINVRLVAYFKNVQDSAEKHGRTYAYAETYEDFIKMIQDCDNIDALQRMRYYIVSEIMQATTISNFKRSKGIDADKELNTQKRNKGDLLHSRNLSRYLNQLRYAKGICEKRLKLLGGPDYITSPSKSTDVSLEAKMAVPGKKVLLMAVIMQSSLCRQHFSKFLQKEEKHGLLGFWEAVEELKVADKTIWHQVGNDIVRVYIYNQGSGIKLSKNTLKGIEEFMMANKGPDAFFEAQSEVYQQLEENFYASFIVSDVYHKMLSEAERQGIDFIQGLKHSTDDGQDDVLLSASQLEKSDDSDLSLFEHSSYARTQLKILRAKLHNKRQALQALQSNPKSDKKMTSKLDFEIANLCVEQKLLENHIEKTELWIKYLGLWQATIGQAVVNRENDKSVPYCNIMVHLSNEAGHPEGESVGWVVSRNLSSFHALHQKLVPAAVWLKKIELPTKPIFKSLDKHYLEKLKAGLQTFLLAVTKDDGLNKSEALYSFLIPSPDHMKHPQFVQKKNFKFNFLQIFKGFQSNSSQADETDDEVDLLLLDDNDGKDDRKDSIAEPLYSLIGEIFELKGVFNWMRRTLIMFVQLTYGKTINKQLHESVSWISSEPMLLYYLQMFRDTMWPTTKPEKVAPRPDDKKLETKLLAMQMLCNNIPEVLNNLVGQQNARKGIMKIFEALQNETLNKQLLYKIIEAFVYEYEPELKKVQSTPGIDIPFS